MSWSLILQGNAQEILQALKCDLQAKYFPEGLLSFAEEMLSKAEVKVKGELSLSTNGHVVDGLGQVHLSISPQVPRDGENDPVDNEEESPEEPGRRGGDRVK